MKYRVIIGAGEYSSVVLVTEDEQEAKERMRVRVANHPDQRFVFGRIEQLVDGVWDAIWLAV